MITKRREFFPFMRLVPLNVRIKEGNELNDFILHFFFSRSTLFMLYIHAKRLHHKKEIIKVWDICILRRFVIFCDLFVSIDAIALIYWVFSECDLLHLHNKRENWTFNNLTATNRLLELFFSNDWNVDLDHYLSWADSLGFLGFKVPPTLLTMKYL